MAERQQAVATVSPPAGSALAERLCSVIAAREAQDPIGSGGTVTRLLAIELPTPWGVSFYDADPSGSLLQRLNAVRAAAFAKLRVGGALPATGYPGIHGIAPDREWSRPDQRRVLLATRPDGPFAQFDMREYLFPTDSPALVELASAFFEEPEHLGVFDRFKTSAPAQREFFVCTHGHVDLCCARFGVPLYRQARAAYPAVRAWRMTHFGGHRFAPTAWEFPSGYKWAFLDDAATARVIARDGDPAALAANLRGWSGVPLPVQLLDREGLRRYGWNWLGYRRAGEIVDSDEAAGRWQVRLAFESEEGPGEFRGTVVVSRELQDAGCGQHWGEHQYVVRELRLERLVRY